MAALSSGTLVNTPRRIRWVESAAQEAPALCSDCSGGASGAVVEAGHYISRRVYVGMKQSTTGASQVEVEIDLSRRLKRWVCPTSSSTESPAAR